MEKYYNRTALLNLNLMSIEKIGFKISDLQFET